MSTFTIFAKCFGGLAVEVDAGLDGMTDARFAKSGNRLPLGMYERLANSAEDMAAVDCEVGNAAWHGDYGRNGYSAYVRGAMGLRS